MIYHFIDANAKNFMGEVTLIDIPQDLRTVLFPLLIRYIPHTALNASSVEFQLFDKINKPTEIRSRIVTMYEADHEQARLYKKHRDRLYKEVM